MQEETTEGYNHSARDFSRAPVGNDSDDYDLPELTPGSRSDSEDDNDEKRGPLQAPNVVREADHTQLPPPSPVWIALRGVTLEAQGPIVSYYNGSDDNGHDTDDDPIVPAELAPGPLGEVVQYQEGLITNQLEDVLRRAIEGNDRTILSWRDPNRFTDDVTGYHVTITLVPVCKDYLLTETEVPTQKLVDFLHNLPMRLFRVRETTTLNDPNCQFFFRVRLSRRY